MSFWKFGSFTQQSAIDTLLNTASGPSTPGAGSFLDPTNSSGNGGNGGSADHVPILTLEQLLEEDDLLQECKNGHTKLVRCYRASRHVDSYAVSADVQVDFLGRPRVVRRLLDYIDGSAFEADDEIPSTPSENENRQRKRIKSVKCHCQNSSSADLAASDTLMSARKLFCAMYILLFKNCTETWTSISVRALS